MKNVKKILAFLLTILIILVWYSSFFESFGVSDYFKGRKEGQAFSKSIINMILPATRAVAAGVAVIGITIMGTRYMAAAPTERSEIKNQIITFVVGILLVSGAVEIAGYLKQAAEKF